MNRQTIPLELPVVGGLLQVPSGFSEHSRLTQQQRALYDSNRYQVVPVAQRGNPWPGLPTVPTKTASELWDEVTPEAKTEKLPQPTYSGAPRTATEAWDRVK